MVPIQQGYDPLLQFVHGNDAVGALGYAFNQPLPQHYHATGWPHAAPFDGKYLYVAAASDAETDTAQAGQLPFTHGIGNPMTGGSTDAAFASRSGKAVVLESFGLAGAGYHARDEYIEIDSIVPRLYLMTRMLQTVARAP